MIKGLPLTDLLKYLLKGKSVWDISFIIYRKQKE